MAIYNRHSNSSSDGANAELANKEYSTAVPTKDYATHEIPVISEDGVAHYSDHSHLHRGLKSRHITMIAIGGAIGTGLIIGTGKALAQSG